MIPEKCKRCKHARFGIGVAACFHPENTQGGYGMTYGRTIECAPIFTDEEKEEKRKYMCPLEE